MKPVLAALCLLAGLALGHGATAAAPKASDLVRAELEVEPGAIVPGKPFTAAIRLTMKEHWHTYWINPGDSGIPSEVRWTLPDGLSAGELMWPTPERIPVSHLVNYGYEREAVILATLTPSASLAPGRPVAIRADVEYLVCERECIPGKASVGLDVQVSTDGAASAPNPQTARLFETARERLPVPSPWQSSVETDGDVLRVRVAAVGLRADRLRDAYLFPFDDAAVEHAAPQGVAVDAGGLTLTLRRSNLSTTPITQLGGVLVLDEALDTGVSRQAFEIGRPPAAAASRPGASEPVPAPASEVGLATLLGALALAFAGGLVLNLMPCVFPVLSIKVLSLVRHSGQGPRLVRLNGLAYAAGVVASFVALAALLLSLRAAGAEIGWGFQLQSPLVVTALAFLLLAMGLAMSGAVELGAGLAGWSARFASGSGLGGSFATGVLATVVATPCTAPFMGTAVGFALTAAPAVAMAVFVALGLGLAAPFLLLTLAPQLVGRLPRPGAWMEILKQVLAFPIYATVAWLVFVLSQEVGPSGLFAALVGLVLVGFAVWSLRLVGAVSGSGRRFGQAALALTLVGLVAVGYSVDRDRAAGGTTLAATAGSDYEPFTQARLDALRAEGRPVFVNMTAAWCITCLVNERTALGGTAVKDAFRDRRIAYLKGDWTNQNPEITRLLERHGRSGVPLYVLYPSRGEAVVLPQILTEATVLESLSKAGDSRRADLPSGITKE